MLRFKGSGQPHSLHAVRLGRIHRAWLALALVAVIGVLIPTRAAQADGGGGGGGSPPPAGPPPSFQGLGQLAGGIQSYALGVSGNGTVVVGYAVDAASVDHAFRWTAATGMQDLGNLGVPGAEAYAANLDGSVVVGTSHDGSPGLGYHAFRWTASGGMQALPIANGWDVSADGAVVVGGAVWTQSGGIQPPLGTLGGCCTQALGVSSDGSVLTGWSTNASGFLHAFRWTSATGLQDLGTIGGTESIGQDAAANGAVVVGQARDKDGFWHAVNWTAASGMRDLGTLGGPMSAAYRVSDDGSVIVGTSLTTSSSVSNHAFRWTTTRQMQDLQQELLNAGVTAVQNWILFTANDVSADGTVIVGYGLNPTRQWEAFRAVLPLPQ